MIGLPPLAGAVQVTVADPSAAVAVTALGAAGATGTVEGPRLMMGAIDGVPWLFRMKSM